MNKALLVIYALNLLALLMAAHFHGKPCGPVSFWAVLSRTVIGLVLVWWALGWRFI